MTCANIYSVLAQKMQHNGLFFVYSTCHNEYLPIIPKKKFLWTFRTAIIS